MPYFSAIRSAPSNCVAHSNRSKYERDSGLPKPAAAPASASAPIGTRLRFSTPHAITTSSTPAPISEYPRLTAYCDEPHCESTVVHATSTDPPCDNHAGARDVHGLHADLVDAATDHLADRRRRQPLPLEHGLHHRPQHIGRVYGRQRAVALADRRPHGIDDHDLAHHVLHLGLASGPVRHAQRFVSSVALRPPAVKPAPGTRRGAICGSTPIGYGGRERTGMDIGRQRRARVDRVDRVDNPRKAELMRINRAFAALVAAASVATVTVGLGSPAAVQSSKPPIIQDRSAVEVQILALNDFHGNLQPPERFERSGRHHRRRRRRVPRHPREGPRGDEPEHDRRVRR